MSKTRARWTLHDVCRRLDQIIDSQLEANNRLIGLQTDNTFSPTIIRRELEALTSKIAQQNEALQRMHFDLIKLQEERQNHVPWYDRLRLRLARRQA